MSTDGFANSPASGPMSPLRYHRQHRGRQSQDNQERAKQVSTRIAGKYFGEQPLSWIIFDPDVLFLSSYRLFRPLRYIVYALPFLLFLALSLIIRHFSYLGSDIQNVSISIHLFSFIIVNFLAQMCNGIVRRGSGMNINGFGVRLALGFIPIFAIQGSGIVKLPKKVQISILASGLLFRLALFSICTCLWYMTRLNGTNISNVYLGIASMGAITFLMNANPLTNSLGSRLLGVYLDIPNLRAKSFRVLFNKKTDNSGISIKKRLVFSAYALGCLLFLVLIISVVAELAANWLEGHYKGAGVVLFLVVCIAMVSRVYNRNKNRRSLMKNPNESKQDSVNTPERERPGFRDREQFRERLRSQMGAEQTSKPEDQPPPKKRRLSLWYASLALGLVIAFLPYNYEAGGAITVAPIRVASIYAEVGGAIEEVFFNGNEILKAGTLIAALNSLRQEEEVKVTEASTNEQRAKLNVLLTTPTPEDLELATERLFLTEVQLKYSQDRVVRYEQLSKSGNVSIEDYEDELRKKDIDAQKVVEARASLKKVKAGPNPYEIEAARAELERLEQSLIYKKLQLKKTRLVMPFDGLLVTGNLKDMHGLYLEADDLFAVVEKNDSVRVDIRIPETDIADVKIGNSVRLKVWSFPDREFLGEIIDISREVTEDSQEEVVVAWAVIPNQEGLLRSGMTGFGKIDGGTKFTVVAFTRMFVRFFTIEIWSWIP